MLALCNMTVGEMLHRTAGKYPERTAIINHDRIYTYKRLDEMADSYALELLARNVAPGTRIGVFGDTSARTIALFYGIQRIGAVAVMVNTAVEAEDLRSAVEVAEISLLCAGISYRNGENLADKVINAGIVPTLKGLYIYEEPNYRSLERLSSAIKAEETELGEKLRQREAQVRPEDTAVILYTSGSTGVPKAVMTSHFSRVNSGMQQAADFNTTKDDVFCLTIPMFHCFSLSANILAAHSNGACLCIPDDRHTASILKVIQKYRCTILHAVPSMFYAVMARPDFAQWDISSLRAGIIGGSGYPPEDFEKIEKAFGMKLLSSLGQTEATAGLTISRPDVSQKLRCDTVGCFMDHIEGKIVDAATGADLPFGEPGEICIRGYLVMQGYYNNPEATAKTIDKDGWLHTGDLGVLDENGFVTLKGRIKELIIRGGENISPGEIERALASIPEVYMSKVVGVPDRHYGEEVCACIIPRGNVQLNEAEIKKHLTKRLAAYKVPKYILSFESFPMTATGKIRTKDVAKLAAARLNK